MTQVLAVIPESQTAKSGLNLDVAKLQCETLLGLKWNTKDKKFG